MSDDRSLAACLPRAAVLAALVVGMPVTAGGALMIAVTCTAAPAVTADRAEFICAEFLSVLAAQRPDRPLTRADALPPGTDGLAVLVQVATDFSVGLQLTWHPQGSAPIAARPLALSVMDRSTNEAMRTDFYRRVLSDAAMPF